MTACGKLVTGYNSPDRNDPAAEHWVELRTGYPCSVETESTGGHEGPCAAVEQPQTITARTRWMEAQRRRSADLRHLQSGLGEHQARPVTFAESQGTDATPHPAQNVPCPLCGSYYLAKDIPDHLRQTHGSVASTAQPQLRRIPRVIVQDAIDESREERPDASRYYLFGDGSAEDTGEMHSSPTGPRREPTRAHREHDQALPEPAGHA
jgi:hypothetical protein